MSYLWSGPVGITNQNSAIWPVSSLIPGDNFFILEVTDNNGAKGTDTVNIQVINLLNRLSISARLLPIGSLSQTRGSITVGTANNKILFAGGWGSGGTSSRVDIYDITTNTWANAELSQARSAIAAATLGNKIYFAGGDLDGAYTTSRIDVYNVLTNSWATHELSQSRRYASAGVVGNKIVFAGGYYQISFGNLGHSKMVDIYDSLTNTWSYDQLSVARQSIKAATAGNKIYFSGGAFSDFNDFVPYPTIDIYNSSTISWFANPLSEPKVGHASFSMNNKIYWAGGNTYRLPADNYPYLSNLVEIRDESTGLSSNACLFQPNSGLDAVLRNNQIVFFTGNGIIKNKFDIYDVSTNTWSIGVLPVNIYGASIISVNNTVYVAGGFVNGVVSNQVWKLEF